MIYVTYQSLVEFVLAPLLVGLILVLFQYLLNHK